MPLPSLYPMNDVVLAESTASIATTPVAAMAIAPVAGLLVRVMAAAGGTTTGTITTTVIVNAGADVAGGALTIAAGSGARAGTVVELPQIGTSAVYVNVGDAITFTSSGGTGASIPGAYCAVIRSI
jgi:hypothetical protein